MTFRVGQEVVCVDDSDGKSTGRYPVTTHIAKGGKYTIRWIGIIKYSGKVGVRLAGIERIEIMDGGYDHPFLASRFRPIVKTDISIFTSMLAPRPSQKEMAEAYREGAERWAREHNTVKLA